MERLHPFPDKRENDFVVNIIVETPRGIRHKYAYDEKSGLFKLRATIAEGLAWPYDYGFIPGTKGDDGDPLDVLYMNDEPTFTGCLAEARLLGIVRLLKNGTRNDRLVACAKRIDGVAQSTDPYETIEDVPKPIVDSLCRFLIEYSQEAGNTITFDGIGTRDDALREISSRS